MSKDVLKNLDNNMVSLIWSIMNFQGTEISNAAVNGILNDEIITCTKSKVVKCLNIKDVLDTFKDDDDYSLNYSFLQKMNEALCDRLYDTGGFLRSTPVLSKYGHNVEPVTVNHYFDTLIQLRNIKEVEERALETFLFIYKNVPYVEENFSLALLIANKILIEEEYGMIIIPVPDMEYIHDLLQEYCIYGTDKAKDICKQVLKDNCIKVF